MLGPLTPIVGRNGNVVAPINVLDIRIQHDPRIALRNSVAHHSINQTSESSRMLVRDEPIIWSPPIVRGVGVKSAQYCVLGRRRAHWHEIGDNCSQTFPLAQKSSIDFHRVLKLRAHDV